jgi:hypothetical protein
MEARSDREPSHWQNEVYRMLRQQGVTQFAAAASSIEVPRLSVFQNLFGSATDMVWRSLAAMAYEVFPGLPLVGYDRGNELAAAHQAGFETIGPLRVWRLGAPTR